MSDEQKKYRDIHPEDIGMGMITEEYVDYLEAKVERLRSGIGECREEVVKFACLMEKQLKANDHKGGWNECSDVYLSTRLIQEEEELRQAMRKGSSKNVGEEAADVANFCMMIADNWCALQPPESEKL